MTCVVLKNANAQIFHNVDWNTTMNTLAKIIDGDDHAVFVTVITKKDFADEVASVLENNFVIDPVREYVAHCAEEANRKP